MRAHQAGKSLPCLNINLDSTVVGCSFRQAHVGSLPDMTRNHWQDFCYCRVNAADPSLIEGEMHASAECSGLHAGMALAIKGHELHHVARATVELSKPRGEIPCSRDHTAPLAGHLHISAQ